MAATGFLARIHQAIARFEEHVFTALWRRFPPDNYCLAGISIEPTTTQKAPAFSLKDLIGDGFLLAVPKHRRSLEKRLTRKFGNPEYVLKVLTPRTNLRKCTTCGDDHEIGILCPTCYKKVIDETKAMQEKIQEELKLEPVEKEVVVLYDGEKSDKPDEFWQGKRVVEMKKARPAWFSKNLTQQTTQQPATTSDVKPSQLA